MSRLLEGTKISTAPVTSKIYYDVSDYANFCLPASCGIDRLSPK